jgi:hypothetical protein
MHRGRKRCLTLVSDKAVSRELALKIQTTTGTLRRPPIEAPVLPSVLCGILLSVGWEVQMWTTAKWIEVAVPVIVFGGFGFAAIVQ